MIRGIGGATPELSTKLSGRFAVVTKRKESWQGLEQDITDRVSAGPVYTVCSWVGISCNAQGVSDVQATLKLEYQDSSVSYLFIGRVRASVERWEKIEGTFSLSKMPQRVTFYLEGPLPGIDILVRSVEVSCPNSSPQDASRGITEMVSTSNADENFLYEKLKNPPEMNPHTINVVLNHDFSEGLHMWHPNCCEAFVVSPESGYPQELPSKLSGRFAVVTNRKESWQGLEQDITNRVSAGHIYTICALVGISGDTQGVSDVLATLKVENQDLPISYFLIGRTQASTDHWEKIEGTFNLSTMPRRVVFYLEGPLSGIDILVRSVVVSYTSSSPHNYREMVSISNENHGITLNPKFDDGLTNWSGRGCKIVLRDSLADEKVHPVSGKFFASTENRTQNWNGIEQEITGRVQRKVAYGISATVRVLGNNISSADVKATLWVKGADNREQYIGLGSVQATDKDWSQLQGKFLLNRSPLRAVIYFEGPPPGSDILIDNFVVKRAAKTPPTSPLLLENACFGVNIIANSNLQDGTTGWFPLGDCSLSVREGSPRILPPMAVDSLGPHEPLSGRYILATNRTQTWMGPAQLITDKVKLYFTYQVSVWVRIGTRATRPQGVNVALGVDSRWVNGGQVEINDGKWHEIGGSFRIEQEPEKIMVYIQGPDPGVDLMVAGLQIFPVDRQARYRHLSKEIEKLRMRDVALKFTTPMLDALVGTTVEVRQTQNSFAFGSCISRSIIDNEDFVNFFVKNFNWAVFENELKWYWTEANQGNFNYKDADEMLNFCMNHGIQLRGHCIFWETESSVQPWLLGLSKNDLMAAVENHLTDLLTRYKGRFKHYDVNNEMLHGSFYQDRLGNDIRVNMFKTANQLDPSASLFVNDYNIEDGCDMHSSPEKYIRHILDLQEQGAPVGGIGIQGHVDSPVGSIVRAALDKLGTLGLPIWFTELDVSSSNEHVRADDLEVILREAFAHPAVEGVVLWGFWELFMSRGNAHLVNAEGDINEAGKRYLALKQEWLSKAQGHIDEQHVFGFRGFHGSYEVEVAFSDNKKVRKTFVVDPGEGQLLISIQL